MKRFFALFSGLVFVLLAAVAVFAQNNNSNVEIPERNGDFAVPGRPDIRVRVFVHTPKEKPTPVTLNACIDNDSNAVIGSTGWKLPNTNWVYRVNTSSVPSGISSSYFLTSTQNGFNSWASSINSSTKPNLVYGGTTSKVRNSLDYQNIVTFGRTSGSALGVTYVWYYTASGIVADVDTIINKKFAWTNSCGTTNRYNAQDIIVHELGHWFGLDDEYDSSYIENSMYGYGAKDEVKKITPEQGDIDGLNLIYP